MGNENDNLVKKKSDGLYSDGPLKITESNVILNLAANLLYIIKY